MISFIEENVQDSVLEGLVPYDYSGYTIVEAAMDTINYISEASSDLQISTLIDEYRYLYENGTEIEYIEENKVSDGFKGIVEKLANMIREWGAKLIGMIQNAAQKIGAIATGIKTKIGVSKADFDKTVNNDVIQAAAAGAREFKTNPLTINAKSELVEDWRNFDPEKATSVQDIVKKYLYENNDHLNSKVQPYYSKEAISSAVFSGYKDIGKNILDARKEVTSQMNKKLKEVKQAKPDNMSEMMKKYTAAMKYNTAVIGGLLQVYNIYCAECRTIALKAISSYKSRNAKTDAQSDKIIKKAEDKYLDSVDKNNSRVYRATRTAEEIKNDRKAEKEKKAADKKNKKAKY